MSKLHLIRLYRDSDVPDHIFQEVVDLTGRMAIALQICSEGHDQNIVLSALNRVHAAIIVAVVTENGLKEAAQTEAIGLMKNIEHVSGQKLWEDQDGN